jgi:hypothetical protein
MHLCFSPGRTPQAEFNLPLLRPLGAAEHMQQLHQLASFDARERAS